MEIQNGICQEKGRSRVPRRFFAKKKLLKKHLSICEVYKLEKGISDNCIIMGMA